MPAPESHLIIDERNKLFLRESAVANTEMEDIHNAYEAMPEGAAKQAAAVAIDNFADFLADARSDYIGHMENVRSSVGL